MGHLGIGGGDCGVLSLGDFPQAGGQGELDVPVLEDAKDLEGAPANHELRLGLIPAVSHKWPLHAD